MIKQSSKITVRVQELKEMLNKLENDAIMYVDISIREHFDKGEHSRHLDFEPYDGEGSRYDYGDIEHIDADIYYKEKERTEKISTLIRKDKYSNIMLLYYFGKDYRCTYSIDGTGIVIEFEDIYIEYADILEYHESDIGIEISGHDFKGIILKTVYK